jgi:uncharacterized protein (DUF362 family)
MTLPAGAAVVEDPDLDPLARLGAALQRAHVFEALAASAADRGVAVHELPIVIVPETGGFEPGSPAATAPWLVEALIDLLHDAGHLDVVVATSADSSALWAGNRDVYALADILGYGYVTPAGRDYDIVDLSEDLVPAHFAAGDVLAGTTLSRTWADAGYRIVFAKNRTDEADGYSLALRTVLRALPMVDEDYHYRLARPVDMVVAELLRRTPVDLTLIDAVISCHGSGGDRAPQAHATDCIIVSHDIWLADAIGAIKMGLDPTVSRLFARAPAAATRDDAPIDGSLTIHPGWTAPHPLLLRANRARDASPVWMRLVRPWLQVLDSASFPFESPLDAKVNDRLAPWFADVDRDPAALAALVAAGTALAAVHDAVESYRTMFAKDAVRQREAPLGFDPAEHPPQAFTAVVTELEGLQRLMSGAPVRGEGLRWRELDGAVLFDYQRVVPVDFASFVGRVDVARTISYMNDYLGGVVVPVERDAQGRVVRQVERNLYLPQPNYLVLWKGQPIDVGKLEVVDRADGCHRMYWKTVVSENGSAVYDDGIVTFTADAGGTRVTFFGRQRFVLPPAMAALDLDLVPDLKQRLVTDAYQTFFDRTLANLEALVEGREIRIGRPWHPPRPEGDPGVRGAGEPLPAETLERAVEDGLDWVHRQRESVRAVPPGAGTPSDAEVDADGFVHVRAATGAGSRATRPEGSTSSFEVTLARLWSGLVEAGLRDLQQQTRAKA